MSAYGAAAVWTPTGPALAPDVRLTRRGRLARSCALAALVLLLAVSVADVVGGGRARAADTSAPRAGVSSQSLVVEPGDSLWLIAGRAAPTADPREVVTRIRELNGLRSNLIHPGQVLLVPSVL